MATREQWIEYHNTIITWHKAAIKAHQRNVTKENIYRWSIPINVLSPKLIKSYISGLNKETT